MALADERQGVWAVEALAAGGEVRAGEFVVDGLVQAHINAADSIGEQNEAQQTNFGIAVDRDARQITDCTDEGLAASLLGLVFQLGFVSEAGIKELSFFVRLVRPVDTVDFHVAEFVVMNVGVAGNGDRGGRGTIVGHADDHESVGVFVFLIARAQNLDFLR